MGVKNFFKTFLAALLANIVGSGCVVFFVFAGLIGMIGTIATMAGGSSEAPVELVEGTILKVDLASLSDVVSEDPVASFTNPKASQPVSLSDAIRTISLAKNDPNISAIYLNVEGIEAGMASVDALRRAIIDFKKSNKPVVAYGDLYTQKAYYLASAANEVLLNPQGTVALNGIASAHMMYKDALDKLGVKMEVFKVGTFKSAVEPYILNRMSEENKLQTQEYIDGLWLGIVEGIASERKVSAESIRSFVDAGKMFSSAEDFVKAKLVDRLVYRSEVKDVFAKKLKREAKSLSMMTLRELSTHLTSDYSADEVRVIYAEGEITDAVQEYWMTGVSQIGYSLVDELNKVAEDEGTKAVVLRVNSPGGSAFLSEQIWHAVKRLRAKKPVVVSMGDYAASGGYYISAPANMIVAEANTLTGSIGIFGMIPNASQLADKFGVYMDVVKTSEYADLEVGIPFKPMTDAQKALIQAQVERGYDTFLARVAEGRNMSKAQVDSVGQGRVWLGKRAIELGLVDKLGGLDVAIKEVAKIAKLSDYSVNYGKTSKSPLMELLQSQTPTRDFVAKVRSSFLTEDERKALQLLHGHSRYVGVQARLPYDFSTY